MGRTRAAWEGFTLGALIFWSAGLLIAYLEAYATLPKQPNPTFLTVCGALARGESPAAVLAAITGGIGMVAALAQLFGEKPAGASLVKRLFADLEGQLCRKGKPPKNATLKRIA